MPGRPKVLHIVVAGQIGGAEHMLADLAAPDATEARHCVALMTPNPKLGDFFSEAGLHVRSRGPVHENPLAYLWRSFGPADIAWLGEVVEAEKPDLLHAHTFGSHILAVRAGQRYGLPVVRSEHGVRHYRDPSCAFRRHWALRHTDRIVAVSDFVGRFVGAFAPHARNKICVIHNGVAPARFAPVPAPEDGPFTVAAVCRLVPMKRLDVAIEAVALTPDVRLEIAGDGSERPRLERLVRRRGLESRVRFHGYLKDPRPVIAGSDAFFITTRDEPFGIAVIEAAAMQRPAIAFAGGGIPEVIEDGQTGWLVRQDKAGAFAAALQQAAASRTRVAQMGVNARRRVESRFNICLMCKRYDDVYRGVLK